MNHDQRNTAATAFFRVSAQLRADAERRKGNNGASCILMTSAAKIEFSSGGSKPPSRSVVMLMTSPAAQLGKTVRERFRQLFENCKSDSATPGTPEGSRQTPHISANSCTH